MTDIVLDNEDFKMVNSNLNEYDISVLDREDTYSLILRAVETPFEYIGRYILDADGVNPLDYSFGNAVYDELAEGLTVTLLARIKSHIHRAISQVTTDISIQEVKVALVDINTVDIQIQIDGLEQLIRTRVTI